MVDEGSRKISRCPVNSSSLIRFRVKARLFLELTDNPRERGHTLRADQIKDVNALLVEKIEVVTAP